MILHCYYCSLGGERASETSQVAVVEGLCHPLKADMFKPLDPLHDLTPPFQSNEWRYMLHKACGKYPWPYNVDPVEGPSRILTDKGYVDIPTNNVGSATSESGGGTSQRGTAMEEGFPCDVCGKVCKSPLGLHSHKRSHK